MFVFGIPIEPIIGIGLIVLVFAALFISVRMDGYGPKHIARRNNNRYEQSYRPDAYERHFGYDRRRSGFYN